MKKKGIILPAGMPPPKPDAIVESGARNFARSDQPAHANQLATNSSVILCSSIVNTVVI